MSDLNILKGGFEEDLLAEQKQGVEDTLRQALEQGQMMRELREAAKTAYHRLQALRVELSEAYYMFPHDIFNMSAAERKCRMDEFISRMKVLDDEIESLRQAIEREVSDE